MSVRTAGCPPSRAGSRSTDEAPALLGSRCPRLRHLRLPGRRRCSVANPACEATEFEPGASCQPHAAGSGPTPTPATSRPRPTSAADPYEPFCLAAVELAAEKMVVMGQVVPGVSVDDLSVGDEVELVLDTLYADDEHEYLVWKWRRRRGAGATGLMPDDRRVAVLGAGMHPWGKWGRNFVEYGVAAARQALADAGCRWPDVQFVAGADTIRNGYPGYVAGATFAQALGWTGARVSRRYAACASGAAAIATARAQILAGLCDVALVVGADTTPKGFFAPVGGERRDDPDWLRFRLLGATNPTYFALYARRRMDRFGATDEDFAQVKVKNARHGLANPNARYRKEVTVEEVLASPMVADPLRLLEICATSDGGAALVLSSMEFARRHGVTGRLGHASRPCRPSRPASPTRSSRCPTSPPTRARPRPPPRAGFRPIDRPGRLRGGRHRPRRRRPGRGLRPVGRPRARLVRGHRAVRRGRGREAAARRRHDARRPGPGQPERRPVVLRRGHPGPGHRPGVRVRLAAAGPGRRPPGRGGPGGRHRQPGPVRPRLVGRGHPLRARARAGRLRPAGTTRGTPAPWSGCR